VSNMPKSAELTIQEGVSVSTREEAAAKALGVAANKGINPFLRPNQLAALGVRSLDAHNAGVKAMTVALQAADAHDRANGIHRIALSDATVERAARALCESIWKLPNAWELSQDISKDSYRKHARLVLAAAVKEEQA